MTTSLAAVDQGLGEVAALPRQNGELVFDEPWQGRALGMGVVVLEQLGLSWADFRPQLVAAIAAAPQRHGETEADAYYRCFLDAVEACVGSAAAPARSAT